ncbi:MAG: fasciclin domain-containing protein [Cyanobacteria bacterium P01_E01_bin.6]
MKISKNQSLNKKVVGLLGATSVSVLIGLPAFAQFAKAEPSGNIADPSADALETELPTDALAPDATVDPLESTTSVDALEADAPVDSLDAGTPVDALEAGTPLDSLDAETPVDALDTEPSASEVEAPETSVETTPDTLDAEPPADEWEAEPSVDSLDDQSPAGAVQSPVTPVEGTPEASTPSADGESLASVAATNESLSTFALALEAAGLTDTFDQQGPMTVFAPSNEAFSALPDGLMDQLMNDPETLTRILAFHVVSGDIPSDQIESGAVPTAEGSTVDIQADAADITVNGASVVEADLQAENGVMHIIDEVILPPNL